MDLRSISSKVLHTQPHGMDTALATPLASSN